MSLLAPLSETRLPPPEPVEICEACGKSLPRSKTKTAIVIAGGDRAFQCPAGGHVACSTECWTKVAHACVDEHMSDLVEKQW